jgi:hypothetical protein
VSGYCFRGYPASSSTSGTVSEAVEQFYCVQAAADSIA